MPVLLAPHGGLESIPDEVEDSAVNKSLQKAKLGWTWLQHPQLTDLFATATTLIACFKNWVKYTLVMSGGFYQFVLLHNGNVKLFTSIAHFVILKKSFESIEVLLEAIQYNIYQWSICRKLKVVGLLRGMQEGFTKHCCFLCLCNSCTNKGQCIRRGRPVREWCLSLVANIENVPLVDTQNILATLSYQA